MYKLVGVVRVGEGTKEDDHSFPTPMNTITLEKFHHICFSHVGTLEENELSRLVKYTTIH